MLPFMLLFITLPLLSSPSLLSTSSAPEFQILRLEFILSLILYFLICLRLKISPLHPRLLPHTKCLSRTECFSFWIWWYFNTIKFWSYHCWSISSSPRTKSFFSSDIFNWWFGIAFQDTLFLYIFVFFTLPIF